VYTCCYAWFNQDFDHEYVQWWEDFLDKLQLSCNKLKELHCRPQLLDVDKVFPASVEDREREPGDRRRGIAAVVDDEGISGPSILAEDMPSISFTGLSRSQLIREQERVLNKDRPLDKIDISSFVVYRYTIEGDDQVIITLTLNIKKHKHIYGDYYLLLRCAILF
jgi:hypothetical protein